MKEFRFILVSLALLSLGMASCISSPERPSQLDLSTVDPAQPIPVMGILMRTPLGAYQDQFFQKYGDSEIEEWNNDPKKLEQLLDMLCGTASRNWTAITTKVKNETGLTLNGDEFQQHLQNGNTAKLTTQKSKRPFDDRGYFFNWNDIPAESEGYNGAVINLIVREGGKIEVFNVELWKLDMLGRAEGSATIASF
jgi:hypothetical protein